nr:DUF2269 family protein [Paenibacillus hamazuiensis]
MSGYLFIHLLGVVLFVGNIVTAAFWKVRADIKGDLNAIHQAARNVMIADWVFTLPGLVLIIVSGILMAVERGYTMNGFHWMTLSLLLFGLTGVIWLAVLIPLQRGMIRHSAASLQAGKLLSEYHKASLYWAVFGVLATLLPVVILFLMIFKNV